MAFKKHQFNNVLIHMFQSFKTLESKENMFVQFILSNFMYFSQQIGESSTRFCGLLLSRQRSNENR